VKKSIKANASLVESLIRMPVRSVIPIANSAKGNKKAPGNERNSRILRCSASR